MTGAAQKVHEGDPAIIDFTTPDHDDRPWQAMTIDGHVVSVREPKSSFWLRIADLASGTELQQASMVDRVIATLFDKDSQAHIHARLNDDADDFDVDEVGAILQRLREVWSKGRPTGRANGSQRPSPNRGKRSTARAR